MQIEFPFFNFLHNKMNTLIFSKEDLFSFAKEKKFYRCVVVMFTTEWCAACKRMLNTFKQLLEERREKDISFLQVDAEKNSALSKDPFFAVSIVPKTFVFQEGVLWKKMEGSTDFHNLKKFLQL